MSDASINPATLEFLKKENAKRAKHRKVMMIAAPLLVAGIATAGYFGVRGWRASSQQAMAKDIVAKAMANGPSREGFEQVRKAVDSGQITREAAWAAGREAWEKAEKERMTGYFNTPAKDRDKYLDKLIDDMQKMRKEWEARRAAQAQEPRPERRREENPTTRPEGERREGQRMGGGARGDSQSPVDRAMNQEFRAAMMKRMQERGIQMGGRGGPGGGWGGGRGPGGGGGGGR